MVFYSESDAIIAEIGNKTKILNNRMKNQRQKIEFFRSSSSKIFRFISSSEIEDLLFICLNTSSRTKKLNYSTSFLSITVGLPWKFTKKIAQPYYVANFDIIAPIEAEKIINLQNIAEEFKLARVILAEIDQPNIFFLFTRPLTIWRRLEPREGDPITKKLWKHAIRERSLFFEEILNITDSGKEINISGISNTPPNWRIFSQIYESYKNNKEVIETAKLLMEGSEELKVPQFNIARNLLSKGSYITEFKVLDIDSDFNNIFGTLASFETPKETIRYIEFFRTDKNSIDNVVGILNSLTNFSIKGSDPICIEIAKNLSFHPTRYLEKVLYSMFLNSFGNNI